MLLPEQLAVLHRFAEPLGLVDDDVTAQAEPLWWGDDSKSTTVSHISSM
jgi:hypothetical protein